MLTLQPAMVGDRLPYPMHVQADGNVDRQDFWRGDPARVVGISDTPEQGRSTVVARGWVPDLVLRADDGAVTA